MKYLYLKNEDKPDSDYLFPLQAQMQKIMQASGYTYIGEGLKNAINASILGIPFISIESASSIKPELISFLKDSEQIQNIVMVGAFDGDNAGERAYEKLSKEVSILNNKFDFTSGIDFSDYLKEVKNDKINNR
jgi:DNA primase